MIKKYQRTEQIFNGTVEQGGINASDGTTTTSNTRIRTTQFVIPNETITVNASGNITRAIVYFYTISGNFLPNETISTWQSIPFSFISAGIRKTIIVFSKDNNPDITPSDISNIMVNEGSTAKPYQPYYDWITNPYRKYETATDTITTLPKTIIGDGQNISAYTIKGNMSQSGTPTPTTPIYPSECGEKTENKFDKSNPNELNAYFSEGVMREGNGYKMVYIPCEPNTKYTISKILTYRFSIAQFDHLPTYGSTNLTNVYRNNDTEVTLTTEPTAAYLVVFLYTPQDTVSLTDIYNSLMINKGNPHSYEPYGYKIPITLGSNTYPVYLSEPIRKISTYYDQLIHTGLMLRGIKKLVLTGEETWQNNFGTSLFGTTINNATVTGVTAISTNYTYNPIQSGLNAGLSNGEFALQTSSPPTALYVKDENYTTVETWKQFLADQYAAGTPVTVWYVLATPTIEQVTAPTLPTSGTAETFDVNTTLKPSEVSLTYHGWHEHQPEQYINGEWT